MEQTRQKPQTLCIKHLAKNYNKRWVVKDVSFQMQSGQIVGLLGPNGAGKTTSFYMVVGLVRMDKGEIHLDNEDLSHLAMHERARKGIGYLPQEASIFRKLTIAENIMAILETRKDLNKQQRQQRLNELLADFKIGHIKDSLGMSVSGGERRRAEIARNLKERGIGVLITDHNVRETLAICEHAYIVSEGSVIAEGSPQDILENEQVRKVYLGDDFTV